MNINDYQQKLRELEDIDGVHINPIPLDVWMEQNVVGELVLCDVTTLSKFDYYYTSYDRYGDIVTYRRQYKSMERYDYPMRKPSYNDGVLPRVPHIFDGKKYHRLPNEVIMTLSENDSDFKS